ncbi:hypothetical protein [Ralstonia pickettii]|uniref:Uncharacterized protein n=1 Tax=Ralstonia pickettii TaxID=329 RepID=A0AAW4Q5Q9_RALPI|nr:hypothetical protein [Ralstonia pickettii]MBA9846846.1 hypothetical protein [Ralstonia pickettii]MBA9852002.1 hypothetical protein [Ralstonia pickettii]MBA9919983.1 hypothetical protein [Ralstonia pickettii]MBA9959085.1 hypothetical protein [Ralstonia pickettii]MBA9964537.1 hypothetical protein [Ralstonia pickettii]
MESEDIAYLHQQRQELIEEAKSQKQTAFFLAQLRGETPVYLLNGEEVSKEAFILHSGMEQMLPDASTVRCSKCGRIESPARWRQVCSFVMPEGGMCDGIFH